LLWALHTVIKQQLFNIYICSFSTKLNLQFKANAAGHFYSIAVKSPATVQQITQLYNSGENALLFIGISRTYTPARPTSNFSSFSVLILTSSPLSRHSASACHISPISDHSRRRYDVLSIFKMAAAVAHFYFRIEFGDVTFFQKVNDYQHRQDNSIHGREITVSVLQRQTSAILKFFFRF